MTKRENIKMIQELMRTRAFQLRQLSGHGWTREQLSKDESWSKLDAELELLKKKNNKQLN